MAPVLHGYRYSVYVRIARLALAEKGVAYDQVEINPFAAEIPASYLALHPFGRVPTLVQGDFALYETAAITRYVDRAFEGPVLQPEDARSLARMDQVLSIVDSYAYWPMVRQVFSQRVFRPRIGQPTGEAEVACGLRDAGKVLGALEALAGGGGFLVGPRLSLADLHLGAMMAYFTAAAEGQALLDRHARLSAWWQRVGQRPSFAATDPGLPVTQL
jgi:glutathione S-transferase